MNVPARRPRPHNLQRRLDYPATVSALEVLANDPASQMAFLVDELKQNIGECLWLLRSLGQAKK